MKNKVSVIVFASVLFCASLLCILKPETAFSQSERRELAKKPELSAEAILSGDFVQNFESYTLDQFPFREFFRKMKAITSHYVFQQADNNGLYTAEGHISKIEYPENPEMMDFAAEKFNAIYETHLKDSGSKVYLSVVPDKNHFLAKKNGYLSLDYTAFARKFAAKVPEMQYLDVMPLLSLEDYYKTDSHWKQENIQDVAEFLAEKMGADAKADYETVTVDTAFQGVYAGQLARPFASDSLSYLTNDELRNCVVSYFDTGKAKAGAMYNMEKAEGKDPYEMFLSGTMPLLTIENPAAETDRELILFRDSFGSSLAPLLSPGYRKITVVDIRYLQSKFLGNFVDFSGQDVLFLYSTSLLNNSTALQ